MDSIEAEAEMLEGPQEELSEQELRSIKKELREMQRQAEGKSSMLTVLIVRVF